MSIHKLKLFLHHLRLNPGRTPTHLIPSITSDDIASFSCEECSAAKICRSVLYAKPLSPSSRALAPGVKLHGDLEGPVPIPGSGHELYIGTLIDDYSRKKFPYYFKTKSEPASRFIRHFDDEKARGNPCLDFVYDGGSEVVNNVFASACSERSITRHSIPTYTPERNRKVERPHRDSNAAVAIMIAKCNLPFFWKEAHTHHIRRENISPHSILPDGQYPDLLYNKRPSLMFSRFRTFGCVCYVHTPKVKRQKWDLKGMRAIHLGFADNEYDYLCYILESHTFVTTSHIKFHDDVFLSTDDITKFFPKGRIWSSVSPGGELICSLDSTHTLTYFNPPNDDTDLSEINSNHIEQLHSDNLTQSSTNTSSDTSSNSSHHATPDHPLDNDFHHEDPSHLTPNTSISVSASRSPSPHVQFDNVVLNHPPIDISSSISDSEASSTTLDSPSNSSPSLSDIESSESPFSSPESNTDSPNELLIPSRTQVSPLQVSIRSIDFDTSDTSSPSPQASPSRQPPRLPWMLTTQLQHNPHVNNSQFITGITKTPKSSPIILNDVSLRQSHYIPKDYDDAVSCLEKDKWIQAIEKEQSALSSNETWDIVHISTMPKGCKPIKGKWVFDIKLDGRYKARFVACGYSQVYGKDYNETFSPVVNQVALRALLATAAQHGYAVNGFDVPNAFLKGVLQELVYMKQPRGMEQGGLDFVCKLKKCLYGLKQASREFYILLRDFLLSLGFTQFDSDPCVFKLVQNGDVCYIALHVDDGCVISSSNSIRSYVNESLLKRFDISLGRVDRLLGIEIHQSLDYKTIKLSQKQYHIDALDEFGLSDCKPVSTPYNNSNPLSDSMSPSSPEEIEFMSHIPYKSAIGKLQFSAQHTRPDISFAVNKVSQYSSNPGPQHWIAVKRIFRYIKGTLNYGITYSQNPKSVYLVGYADADWGGCTDTSRSTTGYLFLLHGNLISWHCQRQHVVALSSSEAEYYSISQGVQDGLYLRHLYSEIYDIPFTQLPTIQLWEDNQGCVKICHHPTSHKNTKHIDMKHDEIIKWYKNAKKPIPRHIRMRYHFIREHIENGLVCVDYCPSDSQYADILTKGLLVHTHNRFTSMFLNKASEPGGVLGLDKTSGSYALLDDSE